MPLRLFIRADAGLQMGAGHVMRCLALAQAWQDQLGPVTFATASCPAAIVERLGQENIEHHALNASPGSREDAEKTCALLEKIGPAWCVLDGYHFDSSYQKTLAETGTPLLAMDDYAHAGPYSASIILNQNLDADARMYDGLLGGRAGVKTAGQADHVNVLAGSQYAMLRREFTRYIETAGTQNTVTDEESLPNRLLITLGGSDPGNISSKVLVALTQVLDSSHEVVLVASASHAHLSELQEQLEAAPFNGRLVSDVKDMAALMLWADMAISAAGSTCWELAFMGLPAVLVTVADNQRPLAEAMASHGAAVNAGQGQSLTAGQLAQAIESVVNHADVHATMKQSARQLVDGKGTLRVLAAMHGSALRLRPATMDDARMLWEWRNDPATQASAFQSDPVPYESHVKWLTSRLASKTTWLFIALDENDEPVGQMRFDVCKDQDTSHASKDCDTSTQSAASASSESSVCSDSGEHAEIDVTIAPNRRGQKLAWRLIRLASQHQQRLTPHLPLVACIKQENKASQHAFIAAGYVHTGQEIRHDQQVLRYAWQ